MLYPGNTSRHTWPDAGQGRTYLPTYLRTVRDGRQKEDVRACLISFFLFFPFPVWDMVRVVLFGVTLNTKRAKHLYSQHNSSFSHQSL